MAYVAGAAAIRNQSQVNPAPAGTGADLYLGDTTGTDADDDAGIEIAVIAPNADDSADNGNGWSRLIKLGNVGVTATARTFNESLNATGDDFMLTVTRYGSSNVTNEMFPPGENSTDLLPSVVRHFPAQFPPF